MNIPQFPSPVRVPARVVLIASALGCSASMAVETTFIGPEDLDDSPYFGSLWNTPAFWSDGVPGTDDDVFILNRTDGRLKVSLDVNVTIASLVAEFGTELRAYDYNLFVSGSSTVEGELNVIEAQVSLGDFTQFDSEEQTLNNGANIILDVLNDPLQAILEFRGADIVHNYTFIQLFGPDASVIIRDQNTGLSAFRNFAHNHSFFSVNNGYFLRTSGNFTNHPGGTLTVNYGNTGTYYQPPSGINIAGNFENEGKVELYSNSSFSVAGGISGGGSVKVLGLPCNLNVLGAFNLEGGEFLLGAGSGEDAFKLKAETVAVTSGTIINGNGTIEATMTVGDGILSPGNSAGTIQVEGDLILQAGSTLKMEVGGAAHDQILQTGGTTGVTLGGLLSVSTITNFDDTVLSSSTYTVLDGAVALTGAFSNVASGARVNTTDGKGSFRVDYGSSAAQPDKVILSDYIAVNVPQTFAQWITAEGLTAPDDTPGADPNKDGISNLEAYYRGIAGKGASQPKVIGTQVVGGNLVVTLYSSRTVTGVRATSGISGNLGTWGAGPVPVLSGTTPTRNIYQVTIPVSSNPEFVRFKIEQD